MKRTPAICIATAMAALAFAPTALADVLPPPADCFGTATPVLLTNRPWMNFLVDVPFLGDGFEVRTANGLDVAFFDFLDYVDVGSTTYLLYLVTGHTQQFSCGLGVFCDPVALNAWMEETYTSAGLGSMPVPAPLPDCLDFPDQPA